MHRISKELGGKSAFIIFDVHLSDRWYQKNQQTQDPTKIPVTRYPIGPGHRMTRMWQIPWTRWLTGSIASVRWLVGWLVKKVHPNLRHNEVMVGIFQCTGQVCDLLGTSASQDGNKNECNKNCCFSLDIVVFLLFFPCFKARPPAACWSTKAWSKNFWMACLNVWGPAECMFVKFTNCERDRWLRRQWIWQNLG